MKAQVLTICVPYNGCDKNCPYCVSKMTGYCKANIDLMKRNIPKVKEFARAANIASVLFTGKGEPLLNLNPLMDLMWEFKDFPIELQTNGIFINNNVEILRALQAQGLDVLAVSIDRWEQVLEYRPMFEEAKHIGLTNRITVNLVKETMHWMFEQWIDRCKEASIDQLSFRSITVPNYLTYLEGPAFFTREWIRKNIDPKETKEYIKYVKDTIDICKSPEIRRLPYGAILYDVCGLSVTHFDYCIRDSSGEDDIRSLIFQEDGHLYTTWNSKASRLF